MRDDEYIPIADLGKHVRREKAKKVFTQIKRGLTPSSGVMANAKALGSVVLDAAMKAQKAQNEPYTGKKSGKKRTGTNEPRLPSQAEIDKMMWR